MYPNDEARILTEAAGYVAQGWCRGTYEDCHRVCALGALRRAAFGDARHKDIYVHPNYATYLASVGALARVMNEQFKEFKTGYLLPPDWQISLANDGYARDANEVIACMEKAATDLEGRYEAG